MSNKLPREEDQTACRDLLERIIASYLSGIHHDDVIVDDNDKLIADRVYDYIDNMFDDLINQNSAIMSGKDQ